MMLERYYNSTATHRYIFGVLRGEKVTAYFVTLDLDGYRKIFNEKPTTAKRQIVIKYRSTAEKIRYFESIAEKVIEIGEIKSLCRTKTNRHGQTYTENCGECFEWLLAEMLQTSQNEKSNIPHTQSGDLIWNGKPWQVKFEKGGISVG